MTPPHTSPERKYLALKKKPANSGQQTYRVELVEHLGTNILRSSRLALETVFNSRVTAHNVSKTDLGAAFSSQ